MATVIELFHKDKIMAEVKNILETPLMKKAHIEIDIGIDEIPALRYSIERDVL